MNPFEYVAARDVAAALTSSNGPGPLRTSTPTRFLAGGTNVLDLMKENLLRPERLIDINALDLAAITATARGGLLLGATGRNAHAAYDGEVHRRYPLLSAAILAGASPQVRNMASNAGNLLQRTRCYYFYDSALPCNKRSPGTGCSAIGGLTRQHAILGASQACIATHPSDMCVALAALGARVHARSARGARVVEFADFHRLPGDEPDIDSTLSADELVTGIELPPADEFATHSAYLKIRDRASYAFALVSVAAALDLQDGVIRSARVALGGVAHKPWRRLEAEAALVGAVPDEAAFSAAADVLMDGARSQGENEFKIPLAHRAIVRALRTAANGTITNTGRTQR